MKNKKIDRVPYLKKEKITQFNNEIKERLKGKNNVIFDISTCSSYLFYPVMRMLIETGVNLRVLYTEAEEYFPLEEQWLKVKEKADKEHSLFNEEFEKAEFLSSGIDDVHNCGHTSEMNAANFPGKLILIPNFNPIRANAIISKESEMNKNNRDIVWLIGVPPGPEEGRRTDKDWRVDALIQTYSKICKPEKAVRVCTFKYKKIIEALENLWLENRYKCYLSIGNLGSKMQHLGTKIFLMMHPDVGLWVSEPKIFKASEYSKGSATTWQTDFESLKTFRENIKTYMTFTSPDNPEK